MIDYFVVIRNKMVKRKSRSRSRRKNSRRGSSFSGGWTKEWNPATQRWRLIPPPPGYKRKSSSKSSSRSSSGSTSKDSKCCRQKKSLFRSVLRLSATLAKYRAKETEEKAKKGRNQEKRIKAQQRKKEIKLLADAAEKTMKAIQKGEHEGTYDAFMNTTLVDKYGYNDKEFERITTEILKGTVVAKNPPKAAVDALKKVETAVSKNPEPGIAKNVINNVQNLVKKKVIK